MDGVTRAGRPWASSSAEICCAFMWSSQRALQTDSFSITCMRSAEAAGVSGWSTLSRLTSARSFYAISISASRGQSLKNTVWQQESRAGKSRSRYANESLDGSNESTK